MFVFLLRMLGVLVIGLNLVSAGHDLQNEQLVLAGRIVVVCFLFEWAVYLVSRNRYRDKKRNAMSIPLPGRK
ncbi:MAG: hypothetical protein G01um101470_244 [Parcubacteria group bacterium Gr01-1014_70]|nr:MAG: hypothetical protein G01um101470_244 [Parcubacteria group bacterium Gr01-1014_70]